MIEKITDICTAMESVWTTMWEGCSPLHSWPNGACTITSLLLAPLLRASIQVNLCVIIGVVNGQNHCWIELDDGTIVDPTFGQFVEGLPALLILSPSCASDRGHRAHTRLSSEDEENYRHTIHPRTTPYGTWATSAIRADFWTLPTNDFEEITSS